MLMLLIASRWLHVVTACLALGGLFFIRFIFPAGISILEPELRTTILLRTRRIFKMLIHSAILLFLITGIYNTTLSWGVYKLDPPLLHMLWGMHILFAAIAFSIALYVLAGPTPPRSHRMLMAVNFCVLLLAVLAASSLKWAKEKTVAGHHIEFPSDAVLQSQTTVAP
jgi:uncharacterized membrane protein